MIVDVLKQAHLYESIHPTFLVAVEEAQRLVAEKAPVGRYELPDDAYLMVQHYDTTPTEEPTYEAHREYIDVQILVAGKEVCYACEREKGTVTTPYSPDYELLTGNGDKPHTVSFLPDTFAVFFPEDAHAPGIAADGVAAPVDKIVIKLPVSKE